MSTYNEIKKTLTSEWGDSPDTGLNKHLIATFYEVDRKGNRLTGDDDIVVKAPLLDSNIEAAFNWQSPFENVGQDALGSFQKLAQSGELVDIARMVKNLNEPIGGALEGVAESLSGKTVITKLNSTQIFNGSPPLKITATLLFRAWADPVSEVEEPFAQLMRWAHPRKLAADGSALVRLVKEGVTESTFFPSHEPVTLAMNYKNRTYKPLVIESISIPSNSPIDKNGHFTELSIPVTLATIASIDRNDWTKFSTNN
ncbi:hypothetical protein [Methylotuvimicrobium sp. KM2]|uniref:hypothetical protein n=1 Tax=Methylotuvimicrobium sp. KM2 TaxID=3133976 RepID=UPI003101A2CC